MTHLVHCTVLKQEAEGLDAPPYPGPLGERIYREVSQEGWRRWLERATMIINENGLNTADPAAIAVLEAHMQGFLFNEGDLGQIPGGFRPRGKR